MSIFLSLSPSFSILFSISLSNSSTSLFSPSPSPSLLLSHQFSPSTKRERYFVHLPIQIKITVGHFILIVQLKFMNLPRCKLARYVAPKINFQWFKTMQLISNMVLWEKYFVASIWMRIISVPKKIRDTFLSFDQFRSKKISDIRVNSVSTFSRFMRPFLKK